MSELAFVFPGQGSQSLGMLAELAESNTIITDTFQLVSDHMGYDIWQLIQEGPESRLNQTENTQVAMLTADVAVFRLLQQSGLTNIRYMAGHSLGEYAALVCADAIELTIAAKLVARRGQLMQQTMPLGVGEMAAIVGLNDDQVKGICDEASLADNVVTPANFNAIGQVVIAGHAAAIDRAVNIADARGARLAKRIPVSVPCHCPLLLEAARLFEESLALTPFKVPEISVISNVDLSVYESVEQIRILLKEQLYKPVRWVETIQTMQANGVQSIIECGPGKVLSGLIKRIDKSLSVICVQDSSSFEQALSNRSCE